MGKAEDYEQARADGYDHEAACRAAGITRAMAYAAYMSTGMAEGDAALAAGYPSRPNHVARGLSAQAAEMKQLAEGLPQSPEWLCAEGYMERHASLERRISAMRTRAHKLRLMAEACDALALAGNAHFVGAHVGNAGESTGG